MLGFKLRRHPDGADDALDSFEEPVEDRGVGEVAVGIDVDRVAIHVREDMQEGREVSEAVLGKDIGGRSAVHCEKEYLLGAAIVVHKIEVEFVEITEEPDRLLGIRGEYK